MNMDTNFASILSLTRSSPMVVCAPERYLPHAFGVLACIHATQIVGNGSQHWFRFCAIIHFLRNPGGRVWQGQTEPSRAGTGKR